MINTVKIGHIVWCSRGNVGDDAFKHIVETELLKRNKNIEITAAQELNTAMPYDLIIMGGGDVISAWGYGWDIEYAHFLSKGSKAVMLGVGSRNFYDIESISNYSINNYNMLMDNLNKSEHVFVRDEVTQAYIKRITNKPVECIGDIALLTEKREIDDRIKFVSGRTIAVNVADTYNECFGKSDEQVAKKMIEVCVQLILSGYDVKLFSLYALDNVIMKKMASEIQTASDKEVDQISHDYFTPDQWVGFFSKCSFVISERLHGCILAAAANTPFISLAYRWKCINFCLLFGLPHLAIKTDNLGNIDSAVNYVKDNLLILNKQIAERKNEFIGKISQAFDRISDVINDIVKSNNALDEASLEELDSIEAKANETEGTI